MMNNELAYTMIMPRCNPALLIKKYSGSKIFIIWLIAVRFRIWILKPTLKNTDIVHWNFLYDN